MYPRFYGKEKEILRRRIVTRMYTVTRQSQLGVNRGVNQTQKSTPSGTGSSGKTRLRLASRWSW